MKRPLLVTSILAVGLALAGALALFVRPWAVDRDVAPSTTPPAASARARAEPRAAISGAGRDGAASAGFLYGRVTTLDGATYQGRLRCGGDQEAFWQDLFNGFKSENPWAALVPPETLPTEQRPVKILGFEIARRERPLRLDRPFVARFGDIARFEARGRGVRVTLKSGTVFELNRMDASDFDDGLRVWDDEQGVVDLGSLRLRSVELLPAPRPSEVPTRLRGTVRTRQGDFEGFIAVDRELGVGSDELEVRTAEGAQRVRLDALRAIERRGRDGPVATLFDGRELDLSTRGDDGPGRRGLFVDDRRFGRVQISWHAFERLDFEIGAADDSGPAYDDFPPGRPLAGSVSTRDGRRFTGRLVYDLDESETTETLDASAEGVGYTLFFGTLATIALPGEPEAGPVRVTLRNGEVLQLEPSGDLGPGNAGLLVFLEGQEKPEYVPWSDVERIELEAPTEPEPSPGQP